MPDRSAHRNTPTARGSRPGTRTRLDALVESAARVFARQGFRRTQMADVARELGVSAGALYRYVEGKEALFALVVQRAFAEDPPPPPASLPVPQPSPEELRAVVRARLDRSRATPRLARAVRRSPHGDVRTELRGLLAELYDHIARNREGIRLLESSSRDWPELAAEYYGGGRDPLLRDWERYLVDRIARGRLAPVPDVAVAARMVLETVAWFGWHRFGDPMPTDFDEAATRDTVVALLERALAPGGPR